MRPKILNIEDAWKMYLMDKNVLDIKPDDLIFGVMKTLTSKLPSRAFFKSLDMFYGDKYKKKKPLEITRLLVDGLRYNHMPEFKKFVTGVSGNVRTNQ